LAAKTGFASQLWHSFLAVFPSQGFGGDALLDRQIDGDLLVLHTTRHPHYSEKGAFSMKSTELGTE